MTSKLHNLSLPDSYIASLIALRKNLHKNAELSGNEINTRQIILDFILRCGPHKIISPIGGRGIVCIYQTGSAGPTLLFRAEMDALPIQEKNEHHYKSSTSDVSHMCGHDGQMAILAGLAGLLHNNPPKRGKIILLFQPAEETGQGASAIVNDPEFSPLKPDYVFALHNIPGKQKGVVYLRSGIFNCASSGLIVRLKGRSSHASRPEDGLDPTLVMGEIIHGLNRLPIAPEFKDIFSMTTVVFARLGEKSFGTTPGEAEIRATLRCEDSQILELLERKAIQVVARCAESEGLNYNLEWCDKFTASVNDKHAVEIVSDAAKNAGLKVVYLKRPRRWSEDFGQFTARFPGAMFLLGAGETCPPLHSPEYNFPDDLIETGLVIYREIINQVFNRSQ
jgi:amidohydrolase